MPTGGRKMPVVVSAPPPEEAPTLSSSLGVLPVPDPDDHPYSPHTTSPPTAYPAPGWGGVPLPTSRAAPAAPSSPPAASRASMRLSALPPPPDTARTAVLSAEFQPTAALPPSAVAPPQGHRSSRHGAPFSSAGGPTGPVSPGPASGSGYAASGASSAPPSGASSYPAAGAPGSAYPAAGGYAGAPSGYAAAPAGYPAASGYGPTGYPAASSSGAADAAAVAAPPPTTIGPVAAQARGRQAMPARPFPVVVGGGSAAAEVAPAGGMPTSRGPVAGAVAAAPAAEASRSRTKSPIGRLIDAARSRSARGKSPHDRGGSASMLPVGPPFIIESEALALISPAGPCGQARFAHPPAVRWPPARPPHLLIRDIAPGAGAVAVVGVRNLGNTCFLGAVLQALVHCDAVAASLLTRLTAPAPPGSPQSQIVGAAAPGAVTGMLQALCGDVWLGVPHNVATGKLTPDKTGSPAVVALTPRLAASVVLGGGSPALAQRFVVGRQHDAHECLRLLLEVAFEETLHTPLARPVSTPACDAVFPSWGLGVPLGSDAARQVWESDAAQGGDSTLRGAFRGLLATDTTCRACGNCRTQFEVFLDLSVPPPRKRGALPDALAAYFGPETLTPADAPSRCEMCGQAAGVVRVPRIAAAPPVLVIQVKRAAMGGEKTAGLQWYPTTGLDLTPWVHHSAARLTGRPCVYDLTAVVCHSGSSSASGHYTVLGKDLSAAVDAAAAWHLYDDGAVKRTTDVVRTSACLLFYAAAPLPLHPSPAIAAAAPPAVYGGGAAGAAGVAPPMAAPLGGMGGRESGVWSGMALVDGNPHRIGGDAEADAQRRHSAQPPRISGGGYMVPAWPGAAPHYGTVAPRASVGPTQYPSGGGGMSPYASMPAPTTSSSSSAAAGGVPTQYYAQPPTTQYASLSSGGSGDPAAFRSLPAHPRDGGPLTSRYAGGAGAYATDSGGRAAGGGDQWAW